jgi:hypothetical protein
MSHLAVVHPRYPLTWFLDSKLMLTCDDFDPGDWATLNDFWNSKAAQEGIFGTDLQKNATSKDFFVLRDTSETLCFLIQRILWIIEKSTARANIMQKKKQLLVLLDEMMAIELGGENMEKVKVLREKHNQIQAPNCPII